MSIWYFLCELFPVEMLRWDFMKNALLAILVMAPLFGLLSTMVVTGKMSFFSDALGHNRHKTEQRGHNEDCQQCVFHKVPL